MWFEGSRLHWDEASEDTQDFFDIHEHIVPDFTGIDSHFDQSKMDNDLNYIMDNSKMPYINIDIPVPHKDIFEEANHLLYTACYTAHRPCSAGWMSLAIHGMSSEHTNVPSDYNLPDSAEDDLSDWTDIAKFCPRTVEWMKDEMLYDEFTRVRFMAVLPGGWLAPHRDKDSVQGVGATNVAINTPDGCAMAMGGWGTVPQPAGSMVKLNTGYEHAVWTRSAEPRIHMIFDGGPSNEFKRRTNQGYKDMLGIK